MATEFNCSMKNATVECYPVTLEDVTKTYDDEEEQHQLLQKHEYHFDSR
jgi:DNA-binding transcriptional regulator of glucitol operon